MREPQKARTVMVDAGQAGNYLEFILDLVLPYLPLRDICKTSILSRKWRYKWTTVPVLNFSRLSRRTPRANIINHVLSLHSGSIQALQISINPVPDIDRWIHYVSRMPIKSLELNLYGRILGEQRYALPPSFFNCDSLVHLQLVDCLVCPPSSFKGFHNLKCLLLYNVTMTQVGSDLISSCPLLEELRLQSIEGHVNLKIDSPSLQSAYITGDIGSLTLQCPLVKCMDIEIGMSHDSKVGCCSDMESRMIQFFVNLPAIQELTLKDYLLKCLAVGVIPERLPSPFSTDVSMLDMDIDFTDQSESLAALCLFKSSPALTRLYARARRSDGVDHFRSDDDEDDDSYYFDEERPSIWADDLRCHWRFDKLETVEVVVSDHKAELEFIEYVLKSSPVPEDMMVYCNHAGGRLEASFLVELLAFSRASTKARVFAETL